MVAACSQRWTGTPSSPLERWRRIRLRLENTSGSWRELLSSKPTTIAKSESSSVRSIVLAPKCHHALRRLGSWRRQWDFGASDRPAQVQRAQVADIESRKHRFANRLDSLTGFYFGGPTAGPPAVDSAARPIALDRQIIGTRRFAILPATASKISHDPYLQTTHLGRRLRLRRQSPVAAWGRDRRRCWRANATSN